MIFSPAISRIAAIVFSVCCLFIIWLFVLSPLTTQIAAQQELLTQNLERLSRYENLQARKGSIQSTLNSANGQILPVYTGESVSTMAASFQRDIGRMVSQSGMSLDSVRPDNSTNKSDENSFYRIALQLNMTGTTAQLTDLLRYFDNHAQLILAENLTIRSLNNGSPTRATSLSARFYLVAYGETLE